MGRIIKDPLDLPFCAYPTADQTELHGLQTLPDSIPPVDFEKAEPYRSHRYQLTPALSLTKAQLLQVARGMGASFAKRDPISRHLILTEEPPQQLQGGKHSDTFGEAAFGGWTFENILYWFVRGFILTDPSDNMCLNEPVLSLCFAILDGDEVIGFVIYVPVAADEPEPELDPDDHFRALVMENLDPIFSLLDEQNTAGTAALREKYPDFDRALHAGKVLHGLMVARFDALPTQDTFELVVGSHEHIRDMGYEYIVIEATNPWSGAALEAEGATRVHYMPYRAQKRVAIHTEDSESVSSPDGYPSANDSGSMFYVLRLP